MIHLLQFLNIQQAQRTAKNNLVKDDFSWFLYKIWKIYTLYLLACQKGGFHPRKFKSWDPSEPLSKIYKSGYRIISGVMKVSTRSYNNFRPEGNENFEELERQWGTKISTSRHKNSVPEGKSILSLISRWAGMFLTEPVYSVKGNSFQEK